MPNVVADYQVKRSPTERELCYMGIFEQAAASAQTDFLQPSAYKTLNAIIMPGVIFSISLPS